MIELIEVEKMFNKNNGLKNVNLKIETGTIIGILGPNGTGKTTLINLIQGFITPKKGTVLINKIKTTDKKFNLANIAYASSLNLFPKNMSVKEYVKFIKQFNSKNMIDFYAQKFSLDIMSKIKIKNLSTGQIQKLKICLTLGFEKDIYIFDEPTNGLDPLIKKEFLKCVEEIPLKNKIIIYVSHILEEIEHLCSKLVIVNDNQVSSIIAIKNQKLDLLEIYESYINKKAYSA